MTPEQCRAARALLDMSQKDLCGLAGITHKPLVDFERGKTTPYARTIESLRRVFEDRGVVFVEPNGLGPGVRMREPEVKG